MQQSYESAFTDTDLLEAASDVTKNIVLISPVLPGL